MKSKAVLIACQDGLGAGSLVSFLNGPGYGVETAKTLTEIIQTTGDEAVHVVLLNEEIEGVKACDLVPLFKKINGTIQVIVISSEVPLGPAKRLRGAGIFYHAMKPVELEEIKSAVKCACEKNEREGLRGGFFSSLIPGGVRHERDKKGVSDSGCSARGLDLLHLGGRDDSIRLERQ